MKQKILLFATATLLSMASGFAQEQLFSVIQNNLSEEKIVQIQNQVSESKIQVLSLSRNNDNRNVYIVPFSSVNDTKFIILNELNGNHILITPVKQKLTEFQIAPFFIEELRQGALGDANHFLIMETDADYSLKNVASVSCTNGDIYIPRYFYGSKEDVKEALPADRQIVSIFKAKPHFIHTLPNDLEHLNYIAQLEDERSYYIYMYRLPDGTLCTHDEHFNPDDNQKKNRIGENLQFDLSGTMTAQQHTPVEYALRLLSQQLEGKVPVDVNISFEQMDAGTIGYSTLMQMFLNTQTQTYYQSSLWNQLVGYDATFNRDIKIVLNSNMDWYYGTDGYTPFELFDLATAVLHEVTHGLGFGSIISANGSYSFGQPSIYDRQLYKGLSGPCITELSQSERAVLIKTWPSIYAGAPGSQLIKVNGGNRMQIATWNGIFFPGTSVSHWTDYTETRIPVFMGPLFGNGTNDVIHFQSHNSKELAMLVDMGWVPVSFGGGNCLKITDLNITFNSDCEAKLTWTAPYQLPKYAGSRIFSEGFEGENLNEWKLLNSSGVTWGLIKPNPQDDICSRSGNGYVGVFTTEGENQNPWLNPCLISPAFKSPETYLPIRLYLQTIGSTPELSVFITDKPDPYNFTFMAGVTLQPSHFTCWQNWIQYNGYIHVPNTSKTLYLWFMVYPPAEEDGGFILDDIEFKTGLAGDETSLAHNIYRDGVLIASNIRDNSYTDKGFTPDVDHVWSVQVACEYGGLSDPVSITGKCVKFVAVTNITNVPTTATAGIPLTLTCTVTPTNATNKTIDWSIKNQGTTNATISGNTFSATTGGTATVTATIANGIAMGTDYTKDFNIIVNTVGIIELAQELSNVQVHPNPTTGELRIESGELRINYVEIFDVYGRKLLSPMPQTFPKTVLNISHLQAGVYFVKIRTEAGEVVKKVLKE